MICFRLLKSKDPAQPLANAVRALACEEDTNDTYEVEAESFRHIPNAPFAYWVSDKIRRLFKALPPFEGDGRTAKVGLQSSDDFRFVRTAWEAPIKDTDKIWFLLAKGGDYSEFYTDIYLLANWGNSGNEIKHFGDPSGIKPNSRPQNTDYYFLPGITWTNSTTTELSARLLPAGCVFSHMGPTAFASKDETLPLLAWINSRVTALFIKLQLGLAAAGRKHYEVGIIQRVPFCYLNENTSSDLGDLAKHGWSCKRKPDTANLTSHAFYAPALAPSRALSTSGSK